mmetsp:Transcript_58974/g.97543  ORF Transcript_58974/g.97543 Transcript_58974/m.97543 type:complete len:96 (-) Transcript_58974:100-387(-)
MLVLLLLYLLTGHQQFLSFHIMPSRENVPDIKDVELATKWINEIRNHYYGVSAVPIRKAIVIDAFGVDIGPIIISYLPADDHFEGMQEIVMAKTL